MPAFFFIGKNADGVFINGLDESGKRYQRLCIEFLGVWIAFATFVWYNSIKMNDTFGRSMANGKILESE